MTNSDIALSSAALEAICERVNAATPGPWRPLIEGRDVMSGESFVQTDTLDFYISVTTDADIDFIGHARQDIPILVAEVRRLKKLVDEPVTSSVQPAPNVTWIAPENTLHEQTMPIPPPTDDTFAPTAEDRLPVRNVEVQYVIRGGPCYAGALSSGSGVTSSKTGHLSGITVQSYPNREFSELAQRQWVPQDRLGITKLISVIAAGGHVVPDPTPNNPYRAKMGGITGWTAELLFDRSVDNPNPKGSIDMTDRDTPISSATLHAIIERANAATPGPWRSFIEDREEMSGESFIRTGDKDLYISCADDLSKVASAADLDFIANARQDIPILVAEIKRLKKKVGE